MSNLLSKGIVNADGSLGPNYAVTNQFAALDTTTYSISPKAKTGYKTIPPPGTDGAPTVASDTSPAPFEAMVVAVAAEPDLFGKYNHFLLTGATGLPHDVVDTRILNVNDLGPGSFHLTPSVSYDDYAASPVHRFYQMWQQEDCSKITATGANPSAWLADLFPCVEVSIGAGNNGNAQPQPFTNISTGEGSTAVAFYNVQNGDAPYFKYPADTYTLSEHAPVCNGWYWSKPYLVWLCRRYLVQRRQWPPPVPPANQIENPNPAPGTNNWYEQDGYSVGSYTNCSDLSQPGVPAIVNYLETLPNPIDPRCAQNTYYLLNNYNPGYNGQGGLETPFSPYTIPPTSVRHIGDVLSARKPHLHLFRRGLESVCDGPARTESLRCVLQHLQSLSVRQRHHDRSGANRSSHSGHSFPV